jgi:hypothetical protein
MATKEKTDQDLVQDLLSKLKISGRGSAVAQGVPKKIEAYQEALDSIDFTMFKHVAELGYYTWKPPVKSTPSYKSVSSATAEEIRSHIDLDGTPDTLVDARTLRLPQAFQTYLPAQQVVNKYPYSNYYVAGLHVAVQRGVDLDTIQFMFGGSTLEMLANQGNDEKTYMAARIPHTNVIMIEKYEQYTSNYADVGFQFERFVTGHRMGDKHVIESVQHLQVLQVGEYKVLFDCETDAVSADETVEIKASNPRYWGSKVLFQMLSSGSTKLCHGIKGRGVLQSIRVQSLVQVARATDLDTRRLEMNIKNGMAALKTQMHEHSAGTVLKIGFSGGKLKLVVPSRGSEVLPSEKVVGELVKEVVSLTKGCGD